MKQFALKITTLSPLSIRSDHAPGVADVAPYIPGSTLLGSLAAAHRLLRSNRDNEFATFFLSDKVFYPNLYPASFKNRDMREAISPLYCIPRTAQTCKRFGGFLPLSDDDASNDDEKKHGVRDSLLDWAMFSLLDKARPASTDEQRAHIISALQEEPARLCRTCKEPLDSYSGFYRRNGDDYAIASPGTRLLTRTGINRKHGVVEEKILYNREVYEEQNSFFGIIQVEDDIANNFEDFILDKGSDEYKPLLLTDFARIGTARTRGLGRVEFEIVPLEETENHRKDFKERLNSFDQALRNRAQTAAHDPLYIAITLHAPTLLYDELLRYEGTISGDRLASLTGLPIGTFTLLYQSASVQRVMGWQEIWGLPRGHEYAITAGSVFLFAVNQPLDDRLTLALSLLEEQGIGQRRTEGFGRIRISDSFHKERKQR